MTATFHPVRFWLHWLLAAGLLAQLAMGLWMVQLEYDHPLYHRLPHWHRSLGLLLAPWLLWRWALHRLRPLPPWPDAPWAQRLAGAVHAGLRGLPLWLVLTGVLFSGADGRPLWVFDWLAVPAPPADLRRWGAVAGDLHVVLAWALLALVGLHLAGVVRHRLRDGPSGWTRMYRR